MSNRKYPDVFHGWMVAFEIGLTVQLAVLAPLT